MVTERHPAGYAYASRFPERTNYAGFEGGSVYLASTSAGYHVILDESALEDFVDEGDELIAIHTFVDPGEREAWLRLRFPTEDTGVRMNVFPPSRAGIIRDYAKWTALSALRSGAPIKKRSHIYPILDKVPFSTVLEGAETITREEFDHWHEEAAGRMRHADSVLVTGWAVKLINIYLKTAAYVGDLGRPGIRSVLHPPIDGGLWVGLSERFRDNVDLLAETNHVKRIKDITNYAIYQRIIAGCRLAAKELDCELIEIEQLWRGVS